MSLQIKICFAVLSHDTEMFSNMVRQKFRRTPIAYLLLGGRSIDQEL
jgi:hypothetical protein